MSRVLEEEPRVAYAVLCGSSARGHARGDSDLDVAIGLRDPEAFALRDVAELVSRLESATRRRVDLVLLHEAPVALAYRPSTGAGFTRSPRGISTTSSRSARQWRGPSRGVSLV